MGNEEIARQYFEAWNNRDFDLMQELVADDAEIIDFDGTIDRGKAGVRAQGERYASAFPDGKIEIQRLASAGDIVVAEIMGRGTNDGPFGEIPPTHKSAELPFCDVLTIRAGKIVRDRQYGDTATLLQQLGLMPEMAQA
jgi:steroid delta-isomerase-like uncharacterized protein